jgi:hypothetical protein
MAGRDSKRRVTRGVAYGDIAERLRGASRERIC